MQLNKQALTTPEWWQQKGYKFPAYNVDTMIQSTLSAPRWLHFGAGNIFRAFPAVCAQQLLNAGDLDTGLLVAESFDAELLDKAYTPYDNLSLSVTLNPNGTVSKELVASIAATAPASDARVKAWFCAPSLQMVSLTITEKGYTAPEADIAAGPEGCTGLMGVLCALLARRYTANAAPLALVSMDNCSHNGDKLRDAVLAYAAVWQQAGLVPAGFTAWLQGPQVSFPWTMIDKITPRPDEKVQRILEQDGLEDIAPFTTAKGSYSAAFVNAEPTGYLVIEDSFPAGRPPLEKAGVLFTTRETVDKTERMKVCTCLNPLHTALAVFGCLLGYETIAQEMGDETLVKLVKRLGYTEGLPVVENPGILSPKEFIDTVVNERLPNPFLPDSPARIATDTSQKLAIRFGRTIAAYVQTSGLDASTLVAVPLVLAGWCRYLQGTNDRGEVMQCSPDPLLAEASALVKQNRLAELLADERIFGVDLSGACLTAKIKQYYTAMCAGPGSVYKTLRANL